MAVDRDRVQIVLLRILGVLLIVVGFTLIARSSQSSNIVSAERARAVAAEASEVRKRCERVRVDVRSIRPPRPPKPPNAPSFVIVN